MVAILFLLPEQLLQLKNKSFFAIIMGCPADKIRISKAFGYDLETWIKENQTNRIRKSGFRWPQTIRITTYIFERGLLDVNILFPTL